MVLSTCAFVTPRLSVGGWHATSVAGRDLAGVVVDILTPAVTRNLPESWGGEYTADRARKWIAARDAEGITLLVLDRSSGHPIGLLVLHEEPAHEAGGFVNARLGYLLGADSWGRGFASELVAGFVSWCCRHEVASIVGGVAADNPASARVLTKMLP